jgi:hypothetical protein
MLLGCQESNGRVVFVTALKIFLPVARPFAARLAYGLRLKIFFSYSLIDLQIVVRSQIPALIDMKNYIKSQRGSSGSVARSSSRFNSELFRYLLFVDTYCWTLVLIAASLIGFVFLRSVPYIGTLCLLLAIAFFIAFAYLLGHVRTAFRMK